MNVPDFMILMKMSKFVMKQTVYPGIAIILKVLMSLETTELTVPENIAFVSGSSYTIMGQAVWIC